MVHQSTPHPSLELTTYPLLGCRLLALSRSCHALNVFQLLALVWLLVGSRTEARVWTVRLDGTGDFTAIQQAIDQAGHGDQVVVGAGTYDENLDFLGKRITVRSEMGAEATIIDGGERRMSVVTFRNGETRDSVLEGFTITRGLGTPLFEPNDARGGGVIIIFCAPTIKSNHIIGNIVRRADSRAGGYGGGIYCGPGTVTPSALITENVIEWNIAGGNGGAIGIDGNGAVEITRNQIRQNSTDRGDGGGIWILSSRGGAVVSENLVVGNSAADHGGGCYEGSALGIPFVSVVSSNFFYGNRANGVALTGTSGGGLWLSRSGCRVTGNSFVANSGGGSGVRGGNVAVEADGDVRFERNIIAFASEGGGVSCMTGTSVFVDNIVWGNVGGDGTGQCAGWFDTGGNMVVDPLFCHPDQADASVAENSPALTSPVGIIGASSTPGCPGVAVIPVTWSRIKTLFH